MQLPMPLTVAPWIRLVREGPPDLTRHHIGSAADTYRLLSPVAAALPDVEVFWVLCLDSGSNLLGLCEVTRGILNGSLVHPREVFRPAIALAAAGIIVAHNHPSGDPTPSPDDRAITRQLVDAGRLLNLPVYDHIIVGAGRYASFVEMGIL